MKIRVSSVVNDSIVDGPGFRLTVFAQGCFHNCDLCHNPGTHNLNGGIETDTDKIVSLLSGNPLLDGITLSGGEPFLQAEECSDLAKKTHQLGLSVWTYTGYTYEELLSSNNPSFLRLLDATDVLIDGKFDNNLRSLELRFKGSRNQRIIDIKKTKQSGSIVELYKD